MTVGHFMILGNITNHTVITENTKRKLCINMWNVFWNIFKFWQSILPFINESTRKRYINMWQFIMGIMIWQYKVLHNNIPPNQSKTRRVVTESYNSTLWWWNTFVHYDHWTPCWASDHWIAGSNQLRGIFTNNFASLSPPLFGLG